MKKFALKSQLGRKRLSSGLRLYSGQVPRKQILSPETIQTLKKEFKEAGIEVDSNKSVLEMHGSTVSYHSTQAPDLVVYPKTTEDVSTIHKLCYEHNSPMIPFGAATSLEGHICAENGGVSIDLTKHMQEVISVQPEDMQVKVQAGVTREQLNSYIRDTGLFFSVDPGADATMGGMIANRASGTNACKYGTMRENVLNLTVVLPKGDVVKTGGSAIKSACGYDLKSLFIGSEGTLGTVTEATVKLRPQPEALMAATCNFPSIEKAAEAVMCIIQLGIPIARCELLDENSIKAVNLYNKMNLPVQPTLFFEFHGMSDSSVQEQTDYVQEIVGDFDAENFRYEQDEEKRLELWKARHSAYFASLEMIPGSQGHTTDVCVPISCLADFIHETKNDFEEYGVPYTVLSHAGDGNVHFTMLLEPGNQEMLEASDKLHELMVDRAMNKFNGTCTGEHSIGKGKREFLKREIGEGGVELMKMIKRTVDEKNLMCPGNLFAQYEL